MITEARTTLGRRGRAMGTWFHLLAVGPDDAAGRALARAESMIADLEARWSRFLPSSEITRLNVAPPSTPVLVSPETVELVRRGVEAWRRTDGAFDPSMLRTTLATGYDRPFDELRHVAEPDRSAAPVATTSRLTAPASIDGQAAIVPAMSGDSGACERIVVDTAANTVSLPGGCGFDPGGLGKGFAADLVAEAALNWGVDGMLVNLGGDLRCAGHPPEPGWWTVELPDVAVVDGRHTLQLVTGGVATSTPRFRRWQTDEGVEHHLIDPAVGRPSIEPATSVTVVAGNACDAETTATAIAARQRAATRLGSVAPCSLGGAAALITTSDGRVALLNGIERYLR